MSLRLRTPIRLRRSWRAERRGRHFDHDAASSLSRDNDELIAMIEQMLADAFAQDQLRSAVLKQIQIAAARWSIALLE